MKFEILKLRTLPTRSLSPSGGAHPRPYGSATSIHGLARLRSGPFSHFVIYWKRKTTSEPGVWMLNPTQTEYIENVLACLDMP